MEIFITIIFAAFLIFISWTDFKKLIIYDKILIPMAAIGIFFDANNFLIPIDEAILNAALGFILMFVVLKISSGGLGGGDVKFVAVLGFWLGEKLFSAIFLASILAAIFAVIFFLKERDLKKELPFGAFLSAGSFIIFLL